MVNTPQNEAYTVAEAAKLLGVSMRTVVRMFENEPGVVVLRKPAGQRRTLRIPHAVYRRVVGKLTVR
jgi:transcriptional regulator GlxA family with amidase domain